MPKLPETVQPLILIIESSVFFQRCALKFPFAEFHQVWNPRSFSWCKTGKTVLRKKSKSYHFWKTAEIDISLYNVECHWECAQTLGLYETKPKGNSIEYSGVIANSKLGRKNTYKSTECILIWWRYKSMFQSYLKKILLSIDRSCVNPSFKHNINFIRALV